MVGAMVIIQCSVKNPGSGRGQGEGNLGVTRTAETHPPRSLAQRTLLLSQRLSIMGDSKKPSQKTTSSQLY
ncbi:hypothetical protein E2C01_097392 [Portunus trituberculatus]|uniref:Uncharacterized protein n=1 Tax=Portunus trituberculatus TaxID=210409 RepID=A0A5B7K5K4_PORTR|nr:hypothetical protein [Portunus trituberculatus]